MILDGTYFQGELYLPLIKANEGAVVGVASFIKSVGENSLDWYIEKYERECLIKLLGDDLYTAFIEGLNNDPVNPIWENLKNNLFIKGGKYSFSPVANCVYFFISRVQSKTSLKGEVIDNSSFSEIVSNGDRLVGVWNDMCRQFSSFYDDFLYPNWEDYKDYSRSRCFNEFTPINTLGI